MSGHSFTYQGFLSIHHIKKGRIRCAGAKRQDADAPGAIFSPQRVRKREQEGFGCYERQGLLDNIPQPNRSNNYKVYSAVDLQCLNMIKHAKMLGFTLAEIAEVLAVWVDDNFTAEQKQASLRRKLQQLEEKEAALIELRARLKNAINKVGQPCVDTF